MKKKKVNKLAVRLYRISLIVLTLAAIVLVILLKILNDGQSKTTKQVSKVTIALVNEDQASSFDGKDYNFGTDFVNKVSNDSKYSWQVVSRAVADRAYADKSIDAVIYLPQTFSKDILTLQDIDPSKTEEEKQLNRDIASVRIEIEHFNAKFKTFNIMSLPYRNHQKRFDLWAELIAGIINFEVK